MTSLSESRAAATVKDGRALPEAEVIRGDPETGAVFQVREAVTVQEGPRRRRGKAGRDACPTEGIEAEAPGQTFQVREALTTTLPPPHWANLPPAPPEALGVTKDHRPEACATESDPQPEPAPAAIVGQASPPADLKEE